MKKLIIILGIIIIILTSSVTLAQDYDSHLFRIVTPKNGEVTSNNLQEIRIEFDSNEVNVHNLKLRIDNIYVTDWRETIITSNSVTYQPTKLFEYENGEHTICIWASDKNDREIEKTWTFTVDSSLSTMVGGKIDVVTFIIYIFISMIIFLSVLFGYIYYLKKKKGFTFEKFFIKYPIKDKLFFLYIPIITSFISGILLYAFFVPEGESYVLEYIFVICIFIAITPYTIYNQLEKRKIAKYEMAYAQFLFEIADALRGGLSPSKAVIEIAKTETGILKNHLIKASDNIKIGRAFEDVMEALARPIKSDLVQRYSDIIGKTSKIGGDPAIVIHRAAKDMDDFIKVKQERKRQLTAQTTTIYISFGVLLIVLYQLISMFPSLGSMDVSLLGGNSVDSVDSAKGQLARMSEFMIKRRFFDLLIINSLGTGTIIGSFIDGHIKYGLLHSLILTATSTIFFAVLIL